MDVVAVHTIHTYFDLSDVNDFHFWCVNPASNDELTQENDGFITFPKIFQNVADSFNCVRKKITSTTFYTAIAVFNPHSTTEKLNVCATKDKMHVSLMNAGSGFAAGALSGGLATYMTHWLDTIKVKMQTFPAKNRSSLQCLRGTISSEGLRGLYHGATPAVMGQMCKTATVFMSYEMCQDLVSKFSGTSKDSLTTAQRAGAGAMTGVIASFVLCPIELVKCRKQALTTNASWAKMNSAQLASAAVKAEGVRGLYRGLPGIWVKEIPGSFIYLGSYELAKEFMRSINDTPYLSSRAVFLCGMWAGLCFCITHPIETVKTRVQVMSAVTSQQGFMSSFVKIIRQEGVQPLMRGIGPCAIRSPIYSGIQFVAYEYIRGRFIGH